MMIKQKLNLVLLCIIIMLLDTNILLPQQVTGLKYLRIGELWQGEREVPWGDWQRSFVWPGNHWRRRSVERNQLCNACARCNGLGFGLKDWTDWRNNFYSYIVGGVHNSLMVHPVGGRFGAVAHEFKLVLRQPPPTLIVDGKVQPPQIGRASCRERV